MHQIRKRLTYANVMSSIAVFLLVGGGTAFAVTQLPKNSVGTKQLKNNAVTGAKVKNGSLLSADFKAGQIPTGPQGPKGDPGPTGPAGTARAYALVSSSGAVTTSASKNVTSVTHVATGVYCVNLDASVSASSTGAVISPYYPTDSTETATPGQFAHVEYSGNCGTNGVAVATFNINPGTTTTNGSTSFADQPFFIVVP